jgi:uncharacterized protein YydD (DUF2326 family)
MKADKEERREEIERQIGSLASKIDTNQARMEERLRETVNSVRSELDEKIEKTQAELRTVEASLDARARNLEVGLEIMKADFITNLTLANLAARPIHRETLAQKRGMEETIETNKREF